MKQLDCNISWALAFVQCYFINRRPFFIVLTQNNQKHSLISIKPKLRLDFDKTSKAYFNIHQLEDATLAPHRKLMTTVLLWSNSE